MGKRWAVYGATDYASVAAQSGVPIGAIMCGLDRQTCIGEVNAPTKGAAIVAAHARFPRIRAADLDVREIPADAPTEAPTR